jgi:aspartate-semialdehyde dehydrogenase
MDILGNVIPHIGGEEEKIETETCKILGASRTAKRSFCGVRVSDNATV